MKLCKQCQNIRPLSEFYTTKKGGFNSYCKPCAKTKAMERQRQRKLLDPSIVQKQAEYYKTYYEKNKEKKIKKSTEWGRNNPDKLRASRLRSNELRKTNSLLRKIIRDIQRPELHKETRRKYYEANKEKFKAWTLGWMRKNKAVVNARTMEYHIKKVSSTPNWLNDSMRNDIRRCYAEACELTKTTGVKHHVDHIIPIRGKNVCGLHVPWNLRVITAAENVRKSNKIIEELMP